MPKKKIIDLTPPDQNDLAAILTYCGRLKRYGHAYQPVKAFSEFMTDMIWGRHGSVKARVVYENYNDLYKENRKKPDALLIFARAYMEHTMYSMTIGKL